jgi:hypothetical protein
LPGFLLSRLLVVAADLAPDLIAVRRDFLAAPGLQRRVWRLLCGLRFLRSFRALEQTAASMEELTSVAQLSLKPLIDAHLLDLNQWPVINATSGVSGAGRKAAISNSFCEVSLQPYGVFNHRHHPEIITHLGADVIFTPHLGSFPRGILETITCRLKPGVTKEQVTEAFSQAYSYKPLVRLYEKGMPALKNVVGLPFCDIGFAVQGEHLIVVAAEDNLHFLAADKAGHLHHYPHQHDGASLRGFTGQGHDASEDPFPALTGDHFIHVGDVGFWRERADINAFKLDGALGRTE